MLRFIYADELQRYPKLAKTMYRDRAWQFAERLGWPVQVNEQGEERDEYDALNPLYLIWEDGDLRHGGSMRLLPTTGRTMVNEHFLDLTDGVRIASPVIWECTRFCLSAKAAPSVAAVLMLGGGAVMRASGVEHLVGVFSAPMLRVYRALGSSPQVLGTKGRGRDAISVGLWEHTKAAEQRLAARAGVSPELVDHWMARCLGAPVAARQDHVPWQRTG